MSSPQPDDRPDDVEVDAADAPAGGASDLTTDDDAQRDDLPVTNAPTD